MRVKIFDDIALLDAAIAVFGIEARQAFAEIAVENILDGGAGVLEDVVVEDDEAQGRLIPENLVARQLDQYTYTFLQRAVNILVFG